MKAFPEVLSMVETVSYHQIQHKNAYNQNKKHANAFLCGIKVLHIGNYRPSC